MIEVRIHGRGGQGNVVAAYLLATAAITQGRDAQAFPAFGAERRGAPVVAFVRIAKQPFRRRDQIAHPDYLIIQDEALLHVPGITDGLRPGGGMLVNSTREPEALGLELDAQIVTLPASALAQEYLGRPVPNTALLSAFIALTGRFPPQALEQALAQRFHGPILEKNTQLVREAAQCVTTGAWGEASHVKPA